ncbi:MAG: glycosyltransferase, partial [Nitrososphaeria archaeon]
MTTFLIPAYNEEKRIGKTLNELSYAFPQSEFIVVFDGNDHTPEAVKKYSKVNLVLFTIRLGKGRAIQEGIKYLKKEDNIAILLDADMPVSIETIKEAIRLSNSYDLIIPLRYYVTKEHKRYFLHNAFISIAKLFFPSLKNLHDLQGGFKIVKVEAAKNVLDDLVINDLMFDINFILAFFKKKYRVKEIPVKWIHVKEDSKVSGNTWRVVLMFLLSLVK